jgi:hypothetical protein
MAHRAEAGVSGPLVEPASGAPTACRDPTLEPQYGQKRAAPSTSAEHRGQIIDPPRWNRSPGSAASGS